MVKVIVVEDEELPRKRAQEILQRIHGVDYKGSAASGKEALQLIKAHKPELLILDIISDISVFIIALKVSNTSFSVIKQTILEPGSSKY